MNSELESSRSFGREMPECSPVDLIERLNVRDPRLAQQSARGALMAVGDLGLEQFAQKILVGPAAVTRARRHSP